MADGNNDGELLDVFFALAGRGRGPGGHVRLWSAILLVGMAVLAAFGGLAIWGGTPTTVAAARIENGYQPRLYFQHALRPDQRADYQVTGRLADADSVVFMKQAVPWRCAPIVSGRLDVGQHPRVYYVASEAEYRRAHADNRFAGDLDHASATSHGDDLTACGAPADAYLLFDDGSRRRWREAGRSMLIIGGVVGAIALVAFLASLRRQPQ
jgi:hypothetical protein